MRMSVRLGGVAFVSLRDGLDLGTPAGRLMFQIIGAMAEFERSLIQERVRAGPHKVPPAGRQSHALGEPTSHERLPGDCHDAEAGVRGSSQYSRAKAHVDS